jgi:hypothetical protein
MSHDVKAIEQATEILNNAMRKLYSIENLSSYQIVFLLEHYANNEKLQIKEDLQLN